MSEMVHKNKVVLKNSTQRTKNLLLLGLELNWNESF